ncbi:Fatty-acid amide hydrolase 1 [Lachnellula cervina]|uniref:Fatty-acid amide hydrolase 1 n=1 Tax=Lachnellula cervina TaxID=1316786 RepID=A0A7D8YSA6_9HELO|nr:Fatty-acid amide hydrolase 1 [Lachnellula cervina]
MVFLLDYFQHKRDCNFKQTERTQRIQALPSYHGPFTSSERQVLSKPIEELVQDVHKQDSIVVGAFDTSVGYSCNVGNKGEKDGTMVRLLKDAGAVPYVKTNLPVTLLSFESTNDVWGGVQILIISSTLPVDQQVEKVL